MIIMIFYCQHNKRMKYSPKHHGYVSVGQDHAWDCEVTSRWDDKSRTRIPIKQCGAVA